MISINVNVPLKNMSSIDGMSKNNNLIMWSHHVLSFYSSLSFFTTSNTKINILNKYKISKFDVIKITNLLHLNDLNMCILKNYVIIGWKKKGSFT